MAGILSAAARAALIALKCPHCGFAQARTRKPRGSVYACQKCHKRFKREQGVSGRK